MKVGLLDVWGHLHETLELAPLADRLGFSRYWIAEHQPQPTPILTAALVAGVTDTIRVGTAGILFHYYSPRRTAYDFQLLERVFAGRIDAGVCGGSAPVLKDEFEEQVRHGLLAAYPERVATFARLLRDVGANRTGPSVGRWIGAPMRPPEIWSLGSGDRSVGVAADAGLYFGFDLLFNSSDDSPTVVDRYRARFQPHLFAPKPIVIVAIAGCCATSSALAARYAASSPTRLGGYQARIVGDGATCARQLAAVRKRFDADEIIFADLSEGLAKRRKGVELLAASLELS